MKLHWLPIIHHINKILCSTYEAIHGLVAEYINGLIKKYTPARNLRLADQQLLCVPKMNLKTYGERSFSFAAPTLYNNLPLEIRQSPSLDSFKASLKAHLFRLAFHRP